MERSPGTLLSPPAARLTGFVLLGGLGAVEWSRMVEDFTPGRALLWVLAGLVGAVAVLTADRMRSRLRGPLTIAATVAALIAAVAVSGLDLGLLRPARWAELGEGIGRGTEALGGVRLPYRGEDQWPALTLQVIGALLCMLGALLAIWPRGRAVGYPFFSLAALLVLTVAPVVSLGGTRSLILGAAVAGLTASFLFLERVPVRPGAGIAVLLGLALLSALPLGAAADREEPWFDYRTFAEGLGPTDPVTFSWEPDYGPIDWPRDGIELFRVNAPEPFYWKAETLMSFNGTHWGVTTRSDPDGDDPEDDLPPDWAERAGWTERFTVTLRRLRTPTVVGAGTIIDVLDTSRAVRPDDVTPGRWIASRALGRGDSYSVEAHIPRPSTDALIAASSGEAGVQRDGLQIRVEIREDAQEEGPRGPPTPFNPLGSPQDQAIVEFPHYGGPGRAQADYRRIGVEGDGADAMERSTLARTWALTQQLKGGTRSPYEFVVRVNSYLRSDRFRYSERPLRDGRKLGLDEFLHDVRAGYCQHFSGAMALMLRMGGVPARVATGFSPGGFRRRLGEWIVRDTDAHSWVEAWFDGIGWITVDPTPPATPARSQVALIEPGQLPDELEATASPLPADPLARRPEGLLGNPEPGGGQSVDTAAGAGDLPWMVIVAVVALLLLVAGVRMRRRAPAVRPSEEALERAIAELERALRRAGRPAAVGTTLTQLELRLGGAPYLRELRAARYGGAEPPTPAARREFRRDLAAGLGWRGRILALYALPPRMRLHLTASGPQRYERSHPVDRQEIRPGKRG